jgi:hypothetical protein
MNNAEDFKEKFPKFTPLEQKIIEFIIKYREIEHGTGPLYNLKIINGVQETEPRENIVAAIQTLISSGVIKTYSFHSYLGLTKTFKSSPSYLLLEKKIKIKNEK